MTTADKTASTTSTETVIPIIAGFENIIGFSTSEKKKRRYHHSIHILRLVPGNVVGNTSGGSADSARGE